MRYILASASPRRRALLKKIVPRFTVAKSGIDESRIRARCPETLVVKAALVKAAAVSLRYKDAIVIGADTVVVLGKKVLGKPKSKADARRMLRSLAGRTHRVITGLAVINTVTGRIYSAYEVTRVRMKKADPGAIGEYVASGRPLDKAGGYGIQEIEERFIEKINGDYYNVVGLPLTALKNLINTAKISFRSK